MSEIRDMLIAISQEPSYHFLLEGLLVCCVLWLMRRKKNSESRCKLTLEEEEQIIAAWKPKPLISGVVESEAEEDDESPSESAVWGPVEGRPGKYIEIGGVKYLNMATHNYLGLVDEPLLDEEAERCIRKYGVGSCGPRGFYGTVDVHLKLEENIAKFLNLEETALYSYGFSTIASAIPSYSKAGDVIFADEQVNFQIQKGLQASRSVVRYFKHNDYCELEYLMKEQEKFDQNNKKKAKAIRRFCVVEGIYSKTGEMCPLLEIATLCRMHKVRLFVDETLSFGVVGATGRGVTEHLDVPVENVDLISGSLEHSLAAFGGFVVGPSFVIDHQRISGLGYCFSASLPPLLAGVGIQSLKLLEENPKLIQELQYNCKYMHRALSNSKHYRVTGHKLAPIKHIVLKDAIELGRQEEKSILDKIILYVKEHHQIALVKPSYLEKEEFMLPPVSIRITINRLLTKEEMNKVVDAIEEAFASL